MIHPKDKSRTISHETGMGHEVKTMADIQKIAELYEKFGSYRSVGRELGISRNTVRRYLLRVREVHAGKCAEILPKNRAIKQPVRVVTQEVLGKIYAHLETNQDRPRKQRLTAKRIHELLIRDGHQIGYTTVKRAVAQWKREKGPREVYILQEPKEGECAEFDWGDVDLCIDGAWSKCYLAAFVLTYSLYRFGRLYMRETQLEVIQGHLEFFKEIDAIPATMRYDQLKAVYDSRTKQINPRFLEFAIHYGFTPSVCNPASPHEKGTDEESVGYIRRRVFGERTLFSSLEEANDWLKVCLAEINAEPVYRREVPPVQGLERERSELHPLPVLEFSNYLLRRSRISKYSLVACDGNYYSVPDTYRPRDITIRIYEDHIEMLDGESVIASHPRLRGQKQYSLNIAHFVKTLHRKPGAIRNAKVMTRLDTQIQMIFSTYYERSPQEFLPILDLIRDSSEPAISYAIDILLEREIVPTYDTLRLIIQQQGQMLEPFNISDDFRVTDPDLGAYDQLIGG